MLAETSEMSQGKQDVSFERTRINMPLAMLKIGERARVTAITGGDNVRKHLGALGFVPGVVISVVQVANGSMILGLQDSRIAVNDDLVRRIMVRAA